MVGLSDRHVRQDAERGVFVDVALAELVDVDGARLLHRVGRRGRGGEAVARNRFDALRIHLDEVEVDRARTDRGGHLVAVARFAVETVEDVVAHFLREHRLHGAVAARGENDGLRGEFDGVAVLVRRTDAHDLAGVVTDEFLRAGLQHQLPAHAEELLAHEVEIVDGTARNAELTVGGVVRILRGGRAVRDLHVVDEPVDDAAHAFRHHLDERRIVAVLADREDILVGEFGRVLRFLHDFALILRARGDERARVQGRRAADHRHLFDQDDVGAEGFRLDGGGNARAARAHHDDVGVFLDELLGGLLLHDGRGELGGIAASLLDCLCDGGADAFGRHRGARHGVDGGALRRDDRLREVGDGGIRDADRFGVLHHLDGVELAGLDGDFDRDRAVAALAFTRVGAVGHGGEGAAAEGGGYRQSGESFGSHAHVLSPLMDDAGCPCAEEILENAFFKRFGTFP